MERLSQSPPSGSSLDMAFAHLFPIGAARQRGYAAAFFDVASHAPRAPHVSGVRTTRCHVPALKAPPSISSGWRKKKCATTTNDNDYRRWRAFTVPSKGVFLRMDRLLRRAAGSGGSPPPVLFLFALHCGRCWVLRLDPVPRSARAVGRAKALRHDAFEPDLLPQSTFWMPDGGHAAKVRGRVCVCS
jgi:hypothetical protein